MLSRDYKDGDVVIAIESNGYVYPAIIDDVSGRAAVWVTPLQKHLLGRRRFRCIRLGQVYDAIWTFVGYRKRPC